MPKKQNTKSIEARERKEGVKKEKAEKEKKAKEDALWVETDKHILAKEERKKQQEDKKNQEAERKKQAREALAREEHELAKLANKNKVEPKVTQAEIAKRKQIEEAAAQKREEQERQRELELQENVNRIIQIEKAEHGENYLEARTLDEAVGQMGGGVDKKPKVTYAAFEEKMIPTTRAENPTLKLSQVKEMIWKLWQKSPENPANQPQS